MSPNTEARMKRMAELDLLARRERVVVDGAGARVLARHLDAARRDGRVERGEVRPDAPAHVREAAAVIKKARAK